MQYNSSEDETTTDVETSSLFDSKIRPDCSTKFSRQTEKEELSNLNDRLACYIEKVRNLEIENSQLIRNLKVSEDNIAAEVAGFKSLYDKELSEARILIDELSKEKAKVELDTRRLFVENEVLNSGLNKKNKECLLLQTDLSECKSNLSELSSKYQQALNEKKRLNNENISLKDDNNKLSVELFDVKKQLEEEILIRVDKENALQTLNEDIAFKEQLFEQQLKETIRKKMTEISEMELLFKEHKDKSYQSLQDLRQQYEIDLIHNKEEIKLLYEENVHSLESQLDRYINTAAISTEEIQNLRCNIEVLNKKISNLEEDKNVAKSEVKDLENKLEKEKAKVFEIHNRKEEEIGNLHKEMDKRNMEYEDLMDIKIALDLEINAYRKLLEGEEERLKIIPKCSPESKVFHRGRYFKRKRLSFESSEEMFPSNYSYISSTKCDISIQQVCTEGQFIILNNNANNKVELGEWKLINRTGDSFTVYTFCPDFKLSVGDSVTIWSCNVPGVDHRPPENLVMKGHMWLSEGLTITTLYNPSGEEMAIYEQKKQLDEGLISENSQRDDEILEKCSVM